MSGYYEWQNTGSGKQPWYFTARDGSPLLTAAGLWDEWKNRETGERLKSCTMIVAEPNNFAAEIHDRMPVFLTETTGEPKPARYVPSAAIFAGNQDHIGLDASPIAASTPSPIFSRRPSRFHERSENRAYRGSNAKQSKQRCVPSDCRRQPVVR